jgi:membrane associated rhomboid family serine protease
MSDFYEADRSNDETAAAPDHGLTPEQIRYNEFVDTYRGLGVHTFVTPTIVAINVIIFVAMGVTGGGWMEVSPEKAMRYGADFWPVTTGGQWWRLLTAAFLHFGLVHIGFNMWALWQAGKLTERLYGKTFYILIYLYGALMSSLASTWWDRGAVSAGASGAIFAVFGAMFVYLLLHRVSFPPSVLKPLMSSTVICIGYNIFFGLTQANISNSAHLGGLVSGMFIGFLIARPLDAEKRRRQGIPRLVAGTIAALLTFSAAVYAIPKYHGGPIVDEGLPGPQPDADQLFNSGLAYDQGTGVAKDPKKAAEFYTRAVAAGSPEAMNNLGILYEGGSGVSRDYSKAMELFRRAADHGMPEAMDNISSMYADGLGVPADDAQAAAWHDKAEAAKKLRANDGKS